MWELLRIYVNAIPHYHMFISPLFPLKAYFYFFKIKVE